MTSAIVLTFDDALTAERGHVLTSTPNAPAPGGLQRWARGRRSPAPPSPGAGLRFAFYGRCSTEDYQDPSPPATGSWPAPRR